MIQFLTQDVAMPAYILQHEAKLKRWVQRVAAEYGFQTGDITYLFCSDEYILSTNRTFLRHDYYTDVITFDYSTLSVLSGDIVISLETVQSNAGSVGVSADQELCRVLVHGVLHLTGQDDKTPETKAEMTRKENLALSQL